jgi:hypothetical protein
MSTRARIGLELSDGSILSAYHHWDGYPEWLGRNLKIHFNSRNKASELIDGGDMCTCLNDNFEAEYYGTSCPPRLMSFYEYLDKLNNEEYAYIFRNHEWVCYKMHEFDDVQPELVPIP